MIKGPPAKRMRPRQTSIAQLPYEEAMQEAVVGALEGYAHKDWDWNHFPAGELRDPRTGRKLKRMGLKPGWADLVFIDPVGKHYYLELKRGKAPLSSAQEAFRDRMLGKSVAWAVARSPGEALTQLKHWGVLPRLTVSA